MKNRILLLTAIVVGLTQTSCYINSAVMLKTDRDFIYNTPPSDASNTEYVISPNDIIELRLFANKGFLVIDISAGTEAVAGRNTLGRDFISYPVYDNGDVKLPIINYVKLAGMTIREAEKYSEELFAEFYVDPFVQISVINRRVIVFPGTGSDAKVIPLVNNNTTLLEAIALSGGIANRGKAKRVKLIRNVEGKREVYLLDLSDIEGLKYADIIVQANDVIYIEPVPQIAQEILQELTPIVSLISSVFVIYLAIQNIK